MKKVILTFLILLSFNVCFSTNDSIFISSKEYQILTEKIVHLENEKIKLQCEVSRLDQRFNDWYINLGIGAGIFILLLAGLLGLQWSNTRGIARKQAEKELELLKDKFSEIESMSVEAESTINSLMESISKIDRI